MDVEANPEVPMSWHDLGRLVRQRTLMAVSLHFAITGRDEQESAATEPSSQVTGEESA